MAYTRYYGSYATYAEADKAKKIQKTDNPEAWLDCPFNIKPHIIETTPQATSFFWCFFRTISAIRFIYYGLVKKRG
jgi:hypothetical protein